MYVYLSGGVRSYVYSLVVDHVLRDDRAGNRGEAEDVDTGWPRSCRVIGIRAVTGYAITGDNVVVEIYSRRIHWCYCMVVQGHAGQKLSLAVLEYATETRATLGPPPVSSNGD